MGNWQELEKKFAWMAKHLQWLLKEVIKGGFWLECYPCTQAARSSQKFSGRGRCRREAICSLLEALNCSS
jgi:hypothetical protein